jgi:hypothetical protein
VLRRLLVTIALLLAAGSTAVADTIWVGTGPGRGLEQQVNIQGVERTDEGELLIYLVNGNRASTLLSRVKRIRLDNDDRLTRAEQAYAGGDWNAAAQLYERAGARANAPEWVQRRSVRRLVSAAARAGLFDEAVTGFIRLVELDPIGASDARPDLTQTPSPQALAGAQQRVERALTRNLSDDQQKQLLTFLLAIQGQRDDDVGAQATIGRLGALLGDEPGTDPGDRRLFAQVILGQAKLALSQDRAAEAESIVRENGGVFTEPAAQSAALLLLARSAEVQAGDDRAALLDAALAYMKVVALFKNEDRTGTPEVPTALLAAGGIHDRLGLADDAADLYRSLVEGYPASPEAAEAQTRLDAVTGS